MLTEMETKPTEAQLLLGRAYVLMNQPIAARVAFKNFLKYFPTSSDGWRELGMLEAAESKWPDAEEAFKVCLDLDAIQGHIALSAFYLLDSPKRDLASALSQARSAYKLEISSRTRLQLAEALIENQDYREGNRLLGQISDSGLEFNRFEKLRQRCQYQIQAEDKYLEAEKLLLSPIFKNKNALEAIALLNEILDRYPKSQSVPLAHFRLGEVYLDPNYRDEAKAIFHFSKVSQGDSVLKDKARDNLKLLDSVKVSEEMSKDVLQLETVPLNAKDDAPIELNAPNGNNVSPQVTPTLPDDDNLKTIELTHPQSKLYNTPMTTEPRERTPLRRPLEEKEKSSPLEGLKLEKESP